MPIKRTLATLTFFGPLLLAAALPAPVPAVTYCPVVVYQDYDLLGLTYYAQFVRDSSCKPEDVSRIRKTSTINTVKAGAKYQPIMPETGAWQISDYGSTVPAKAHWTLYTWEWQYFNGKKWIMAAFQ
jgi:hypothetical protein